MLDSDAVVQKCFYNRCSHRTQYKGERDIGTVLKQLLKRFKNNEFDFHLKPRKTLTNWLPCSFILELTHNDLFEILSEGKCEIAKFIFTGLAVSQACKEINQDFQKEYRNNVNFLPRKYNRFKFQKKSRLQSSSYQIL